MLTLKPVAVIDQANCKKVPVQTVSLAFLSTEKQHGQPYRQDTINATQTQLQNAAVASTDPTLSTLVYSLKSDTLYS